MKKLLTGIVTAAVLVFGAASLSWGQSAVDYSALLKRIDQIEKELATLQRAAARGKLEGTMPAASSGDKDQAMLLADMEVRIGALEKELRDLTGKIEELIHRQDRIEQEFALFKKDVELRFQDAGAQPPVSNSGPAETETETQEPVQVASASLPEFQLPEGTAAEQYDYSFSLLRRRDFEGAELAFTAFLKAHPENELAGNAQYWLGETYYVRKDYPRAAAAFLKGFQQYGDGNKGPDSLLKLGMSLASMGQTQQACSAFEELLSRYADAPQSIQTQTATQRERLGCP